MCVQRWVQGAMRGAVVAAVALSACAPPDIPAGLPEALPEGLEAFLQPDTLRSYRVADGVFYHYVWSPSGPWALHLVEARMDACERGVEVVRAPVARSARGGLARVSEMMVDLEDRALAAVNGDFFTPEGRPLGPEVVSGDRRSARRRPALAAATGESVPWIGTTDAAGAGYSGPHGQVVGGYPELLDDGVRVGDLLVGDNPSFAARRHPRTAAGVSTDDDRLWLVVVDGRQGSYSTGMSLPELTRVLESLGIEEALNLDGGGSSVMWVRGRAVSRPSDDTGERPVVNALALVDDPRRCGP